MRNFQEALTLMQEGHTLTRRAWDDTNVHAMLEEVCGARTKFQKRVACRAAHHTHVKLGWNPTVNDILANDWELIK